MKTKYFAKAQLAMLDFNSALNDPEFLDVLNGYYYAGLLSSLPLENTDDGWTGAGELFSNPNETQFLRGIKNPSISTGSYQPVRLVKSNFIVPTVVNTSLGVSGVVNEYQAEILFPIATASWGSVRGLVVYAVRDTRITPLFTVPFISPSVVATNDQVKIENTSTARMRAVELIKKNTA